MEQLSERFRVAETVLKTVCRRKSTCGFESHLLLLSEAGKESKWSVISEKDCVMEVGK